MLCRKELTLPKKIICLPSNDWKLLDSYLHGAKFIISQSGYSTLKDLKFLNANYRLITTSGQAEKLHLAHFHDAKNQ
jgi:hypothetical protein